MSTRNGCRMRELQTKSPKKQNIGQAHGVRRVRRVSPLPTVRDRPGSSPASFPGHGWSQKAPCITRAHFVQSTEPTHRHGEINMKAPAIFLLSWTALSRDKLSIATLAGHGRHSRSQGTSCLLYTSPSPRDGLLSRMPSSA